MSDYQVKDASGQLIGRVAKFAGEPPETRWWAYSIHRREPHKEHKAGFPTRAQAVAWLVEQRPVGK